jgi:hypothetical protein
VTPAFLLAVLQGVPVPPDVIPPGAIEISEAFFATIAIIALGIPIIRAITRRWENKPSLPQAAAPEVVSRLERIEQAVEAIAVEVERIAEAQRYAAKLMTEQQKNALPHADSPR